MDQDFGDDDEADFESEDELTAGALDPFWPDLGEYELEDELDGMYFFDDEDIFEVEDVAPLGGLAGLVGLDDDDDDDDDEDEEHDEADTETGTEP